MTPVVQGAAQPLSREAPPAPDSGTGRVTLRCPGVFGVATAVVAIWVVFQNFWRLSTPGVVTDEPFYSVAGWLYVHGDVVRSSDVSTLQSDFDNFEHPPFAKLLFGVAQLMAGHESVTADRVVASLCTVATAALVGWWIARAADRWTGLLAGGLVGLLGMIVPPQVVRFGREGMLDPVAGFFAMVSVVLLWQWWRSESTRRAWIFAALSGVAIGLATASKENGFLAAVGPMLLVVVLAGRSAAAAAARAAQAAAAVVLSVGVLLLTYLPLGAPLNRLEFLYRYQSTHNRLGHLVGYAGRVSSHQPWWTNFWFAAHGMGGAVVLALVVASAAAVWLRHDRLVAWCVAALAGPVTFHAFVSSVALPFYWVMWMPPLIALAALGVGELVTVLRRGRAMTARLSAAAASAVVCAIWAMSAAGQTVTVATLRPEGSAAVPMVRYSHNLTGQVLAVGVSPFELKPYVSGVLYSPPASFGQVDTVIAGQPRCLARPSRVLTALVTENLDAGRLRLIHTDRLVRIYQVLSELTYPTPAEIEATPVPPLAEHC